jgi:hypothetical protein
LVEKQTPLSLHSRLKNEVVLQNAKAEEIFSRKFASKLQPLIFAPRFKKAESSTRNTEIKLQKNYRSNSKINLVKIKKRLPLQPQ